VTNARAEPKLLVDRLRARSWRMTVQRRTIAEVLSAPDIHLTAEQVFDRARSAVPEISRATVYNTLADLVSMGEVVEVQLVPGPTRYDPNAGTPHHHLVCERCGKIVDVHPEGLAALTLHPEDQGDCKIESIEVTFRGRCASCHE
jgi:Fur family ferric uptake transcriptional regulator